MLKEKINKLLNLKNYYKHNIINILISNSKNVNFFKIFSNFFWSVHCSKYSHFVTQLLNLNRKVPSHDRIFRSAVWTTWLLSRFTITKKFRILYKYFRLHQRKTNEATSSLFFPLHGTGHGTPTNISKTW